MSKNDLLVTAIFLAACSTFVMCDPCAEPGNTCIKTCCSLDQLFDSNLTCLDSDPELAQLRQRPSWTPEFELSQEQSLGRTDHRYILTESRSIFTCPKSSKDGELFQINLPEDTTFKFFENGSMEATADGATEFLQPGHFCVGFLNISEDGKEFTEPRFFGCFADEVPEPVEPIHPPRPLNPIWAKLFNFFLGL